MTETKYIVFDGPYTEDLIIFGNTLTHSDVAIRLGVINKVISAGFLHICKDKDGAPDVQAYGKSTSLEVSSRSDEDTRLARRVLGLKRF